MKTVVAKILEEKREEGELILVRIGNMESLYYTNQEQLELLNSDLKVPKRLHILNPFDNLLIQRKRVTSFFDFEYLLECYVPEKKRIHGYYTLSLLYGDTFVGRFDAKAERKTGILHLKKIWLEKGFTPTKAFKRLLDKELLAYAKFCGCTQVNTKNVN